MTLIVGIARLAVSPIYTSPWFASHATILDMVLEKALPGHWDGGVVSAPSLILYQPQGEL